MILCVVEIESVLREEAERQEELRKVMRGAYNKAYSDYVCVDAMGNLLKPQYITEHFKVILKQNGLRPIRFHDLRHSTASLMLANGVPMKMIQDWLGHSDMGTTANIYSQRDSNSKIASAATIGNAPALSNEELDQNQRKTGLKLNVSALFQRRVWDSNPRGLPQTVFKTASL